MPLTMAQLQAENDALRAKLADRGPGITFKVTVARKPGTNGAQDKGSLGGAVAVYGLGRFPVTLYKGQWQKLLAKAGELQAFIQANEKSLSVKE